MKMDSRSLYATLYSYTSDIWVYCTFSLQSCMVYNQPQYVLVAIFLLSSATPIKSHYVPLLLLSFWKWKWSFSISLCTLLFLSCWSPKEWCGCLKYCIQCDFDYWTYICTGNIHHPLKTACNILIHQQTTQFCFHLFASSFRAAKGETQKLCKLNCAFWNWL